jgi:hypothetical protein
MFSQAGQNIALGMVPVLPGPLLEHLTLTPLRIHGQEL